MKNHFSKKHKGMKMLKDSEECKVQLVLKGGTFRQRMTMNSEGESEWERAIEMEFEASMANLNVLEDNGMEIFDS